MRENNSLWAQHMMAKYCRGHHPTNVPLINNATSVWKRMLAVRDEVEPQLLWIVGRGDNDTSFDRWLLIRLPILLENIPVKSLLISDNEVNCKYVSSLFSPQICDMIQRAQVSLTIYT